MRIAKRDEIKNEESATTLMSSLLLNLTIEKLLSSNIIKLGPLKFISHFGHTASNLDIL